MQESQLEVAGPNDGFHLALRRQGWRLKGYRPVEADSNVIRPHPDTPWVDETSSTPSFYQVYGDKTTRKILRAVMTRPQSREELTHICGGNQKLDTVLAYLEWSRILAHDGEKWIKGPACAAIDNTGPTLEWYVASWFRCELQAPARHGVTLEEVYGGGDLDVVGFVNDLRVFVECKTGHPNRISETDIRWFLQRAHDFNPEIAILLIDTESDITQPVTLVAEVIGEMGWLEAHPEATEPTEEARRMVSAAQALYGYRSLYCCARNIFLTGVPVSIDSSLSAVLRLYHSYIRHQLIAPEPLERNYVERKVRGEPGNSFGIEGQIRVN